MPKKSKSESTLPKNQQKAETKTQRADKEKLAKRFNEDFFILFQQKMRGTPTPTDKEIKGLFPKPYFQTEIKSPFQILEEIVKDIPKELDYENKLAGIKDLLQKLKLTLDKIWDHDNNKSDADEITLATITADFLPLIDNLAAILASNKPEENQKNLISNIKQIKNYFGNSPSVTKPRSNSDQRKDGKQEISGPVSSTVTNSNNNNLQNIKTPPTETEESKEIIKNIKTDFWLL